MKSHKYEGAIVVGAGPNGLAAAITLQRSGVPTILIEADTVVGGGMRTSDLTLPGFRHDVCSAVQAMAGASRFFRSIPLERLGVEFIDPPVLAAHPFDSEETAILVRSCEDTARALNEDAGRYRALVGSLVRNWPSIADDVLGPPGIPKAPFSFGRFGIEALLPATVLARGFKTDRARGLLAGMAAHSIQPLQGFATSAVALVLSLVGHVSGWPIVRGGSQMLADALAAYYLELGGKIELGRRVESIDELPGDHVGLFDLGPRQLIRIAGSRFPASYSGKLRKFRYGPGVFKIDWALDGPIPFKDPQCAQAGTVHLGGSLEEIARSEAAAAEGRISESPFVLLTQASNFDSSRSPEGKYTGWAYCHVPNGSTVDMTDRIEKQIERFAPGFKDRILARHTMSPSAFETYNGNYVGGDINGGAMNLWQIFARPVLGLSPYRTPRHDVYICSASTPPGGGVHGQCGYHAALCAIEDHFS